MRSLIAITDNDGGFELRLALSRSNSVDVTLNITTSALMIPKSSKTLAQKSHGFKREREKSLIYHLTIYSAQTFSFSLNLSECYAQLSDDCNMAFIQ